MMQDLKFSNIWAHAISEWPEALNLVLAYEKDGLQRYTVKGLGLLEESISNPYIHHPQEVIYRNLHRTLKILIHGMAKYTTHVELSDLHVKLVQDKFESILHEIYGDEKHWPGDSQDTMKMYFEQNNRDLLSKHSNADETEDLLRYIENPSNSPADFRNIKGVRAKERKHDGSIWEIDDI